MIGAGDRLRAAGEYCKRGKVTIPSDPELTSLLRWCRKVNKADTNYQRHKLVYKARTARWKKCHPRKWQEMQKRYENSEKRIERRNQRRGTLKYRLNSKMSLSIRYSLQRKSKCPYPKGGRHWEDLVGYTAKQLKRHLEKTMPIGYSWKDFFNGKLHLDHIIPISAFNFSRPEHEDFKRCWALGNLQLLSASENLRKRAKLTKPFQLTILFDD